jgi:hypothetical protein
MLATMNTGRAEVVRYMAVAPSLPEWPDEPSPYLFPKHPGTESSVHDPRLQALRWRLNRRVEYLIVPDELKAAGQDGYLGEYRGDTIFLRRDLDHADESMAICHELMHVVLHPEAGNSENVSEDAYHKEERIVNASCVEICGRLGLGDYGDFARRWRLADMSEPEDPADQALVSEIVGVVLGAIDQLQPQSNDGLLNDLKRTAIHSIEAGAPRP